MQNPQIKERIATLSASIETCCQRAQFILQKLDSVLPPYSDPAIATPQSLVASQIIRAANSMVNELRDVARYYRAQLAQIAEEEKDSLANLEPPVPALEDLPEPIIDATESLADARRRHLNDMANAQAQRAAEAVKAQVQRSAPSLQDEEARLAAARVIAREQNPLSYVEVPHAQEEDQGLPAVVDPTEPRRIPGVRGESLIPTLKPLTAYERLMSPAVSPLSAIFSASPWFPTGRGTITVGSEGFSKWHQNIEIASRETFNALATLPQGYYGDVKSENSSFPAHVVIRLKDAILIWNFRFDEGSLVLHKAGMEQSFRPAEQFTASALRSVVEGLNKAFSIPGAVPAAV